MLISCWDKSVKSLLPLPKEAVAEGREIYENDSFTEFLSFCKDNGCFPTEDIFTIIRYGVNLYEEEQNYFEEDTERKIQLLDVFFEYE